MEVSLGFSMIQFFGGSLVMVFSLGSLVIGLSLSSSRVLSDKVHPKDVNDSPLVEGLSFLFPVVRSSSVSSVIGSSPLRSSVIGSSLGSSVIGSASRYSVISSSLEPSFFFFSYANIFDQKIVLLHFNNFNKADSKVYEEIFA